MRAADVEGSSLRTAWTGDAVRHLVAAEPRDWYPLRMDILDDDAIDRALASLDGWRREGDALLRDLRFPTFMDAIRFIDRVALAAEAADHHPELTNVYWNVGIRLTTHDAGGITQRDVDLAGAIDAAVEPSA